MKITNFKLERRVLFMGNPEPLHGSLVIQEVSEGKLIMKYLKLSKIIYINISKRVGTMEKIMQKKYLKKISFLSGISD